MPSMMGWVDRARSVECTTLAQTIERIRSSEDRVKVAEELVAWINYLYTSSATFNAAFRKTFGSGNVQPDRLKWEDIRRDMLSKTRGSRTGKRINLG